MDIVTLELDFVLVATLDSDSEDSVDGEQEEVVIASCSVRSLSFDRKRSHFHGTGASRHSFKAVIWSLRNRKNLKKVEFGGMSDLLMNTSAL